MNAGRYPLGLLVDEAAIAVARENRRMTTEGIIVQMAAASILGGEEGVTAFNDMIEALHDQE